jgi:hypothetical protein
LTVTANQYGHDLPSILELGEQIISADPLGNRWRCTIGAIAERRSINDTRGNRAQGATDR